MNEHDYEPIPGLPAPLPPGETILWQGAPEWRTMARRAMRARVVAVYFALLVVWAVASGLADGTSVRDLVITAARLVGLAGAAVTLLTLFAWLAARTTMYTITSRRVVLRFGIAMPITLQVPFAKIGSAAVHTWPDGTGDVALSLLPGQRIAYLVLWPHARPWALGRAQPSFRSIPDAIAAARILSRALSASAEQQAPGVTAQIEAGVPGGTHVPAAA